MNPIIILIFLLALPVATGKDIITIEKNYSVAENLNNQLAWKVDGDVFKFEQTDGGCQLKNSKGEVLRNWDAPLVVSGAVMSENGKALLVRIMTSTGFYHGITRFVLNDKIWKIDEVISSEHPDMKIRDRWVQELGAVADDGITAILNVGEADSDRSPSRHGYRMFYGWQTWDLSNTKLLGRGLKMSNGKKD